MTLRRCTAAFALALLLLACSGTVAQAHPGHPGHDFTDGALHPLTGLDHLLAMVAVGLLAVRIGGRGLWLMPAAFLGSMLLGGLAATAGLPLPGVEYGIMASVLVLGLLVASKRVSPLGIGAVLVGAFAFFHGHAHAAELVSGGSLAPYAVGFLLSTALLHAGGIAAGLALGRWVNTQTVQWLGAGISVAGLLMLVDVL
jgi:urease accessory protein